MSCLRYSFRNQRKHLTGRKDDAYLLDKYAKYMGAKGYVCVQMQQI